ncbi:hypothetical protein [Azospirillum endophyticum]
MNALRVMHHVAPRLRHRFRFALDAALCFFRVCFMSCSIGCATYRSGTLYDTCLGFGVYLNLPQRHDAILQQPL